jgi:hypothetical protein
MNELELILKYKMNELETKAFKISLMWKELCKKEFPNEYCYKNYKNRDPRETSLFKYCYKLAKETKGLLSNDKEYYIYILAQLQMLKIIKQGEIHALIGPQILVGEKAWKRWKIWKNKFNKKLKEVKTAEQLGLKTNEIQIKIELENTLNFLLKNNNSITKEKINRWFKNGKISPYYVALSKFASEMIGNFDYQLYKPSITPKIESFFREKFPNEFL